MNNIGAGDLWPSAPFILNNIILMHMKRYGILVNTLCLIAFISVAQSAESRVWHQDSLGVEFQFTTVEMPRDYSGDVVSTVIRDESQCGANRGVLYVHGFNDYFFQKEMAEQFVDSCYNFYAVDLRKYGRSFRKGQLHCDARKISEYYPDIDSALSIMHDAGIDEVVLMGHSTGGLVVASYMNHNPSSLVKAVILNSPFLEWNFNGFMRKVAIPAVSSLGRLFPSLKISQGDGTAYGESLDRDFHGEWKYNVEWKTLHPRKVTAGWIRCITLAQKALKKHSDIKVPVLLMHSDKSVSTSKWEPGVMHADAVLNVKDIARIGAELGPEVTEKTIPGGMHDLVLSEKPVRELVYKTMFSWLDRHLAER